MATHPGVYCLRSNQTDWDEESLWRTYTTLTDVGSGVSLPEIPNWVCAPSIITSRCGRKATCS